MSGVPDRHFQLAAAGLAAVVPFYFVVQTAYVVLTRLTSGARGLAILPYAMLVFMALTFLFIWLSGWYRDMHWRRAGRWSLPAPARETVLSGIGSAMMLTAIPLSYSLAEVSIPLMLVLQRGGALAAAPVVDLLHRRRIHWSSVAALLLVSTALLVVLHAGSGRQLSPLAMLVVGLYNAGFVLRLVMMTRVAKHGDMAETRRYFVEEKLVALPLGLVALIAVVSFGSGAPDGFAAIARLEWSLPLALAVCGMGTLMAMASLLTALILLNARENSFCVPLERACSLLAGLAAAWLLHLAWNQAVPTHEEMRGAVLLLLAVTLLAFASRKRT